MDRSATADGFNAGLTAVVRPSKRVGGTLRLASSNDTVEWDPVRAYTTDAWNLQRLYTRTLLTPAGQPGPAGSVLVPDLAVSLPQVSADGLTYRFTLKPGLRFESGTPITSRDIKYGIERGFAQDVLSGGPTYLSQYLDQGQRYPGPYRDDDPGKLGLRSVLTPDDSTIEFNLRTAFAGVPYLLAMGTAAPVPREADTGTRYANHPISSGPYQFTLITPGKGAHLIRNRFWDRSTDGVRLALPDEVDIAFGVDANELDHQLLDGTVDLDVGQSGVQPATQAKILTDPTLKRNVDAPYTGAVQYAAMSVAVPPFDNAHCRRAVHYAVGKSTLRDVQGGPEAGGDIATTMLPPTIAGHDAHADPYHTASGVPQLGKARDELAKCGHPAGFRTVITATNAARALRTAEALQQGLAGAGITATVELSDRDSYYRAVVGTPTNVHAKGYGLMLSVWSADFPDADGFLPPLVDGRNIVPSGNSNYEELNDANINTLIDQARSAPSREAAAGLWRQVDASVMDSATLLPIIYQKAFNYRGPRLTNIYINAFYSQWDLATLGVS